MFPGQLLKGQIITCTLLRVAAGWAIRLVALEAGIYTCQKVTPVYPVWTERLVLREKQVPVVLPVLMAGLVLRVKLVLLAPQAVMLFGTSPGHITVVHHMQLAMWLLITVKLGTESALTAGTSVIRRRQVSGPRLLRWALMALLALAVQMERLVLREKQVLVV